MVVDMSDPANIKEVSRWWVPGQMRDELDEYRKWNFAGDRSSWSSAHGAPVVPQRIEDGGRYGFGGFGHFGMYVFDFSDLRNPRVIAQFPRPQAPKDAPYPDFALARGRFGSHNTQAWVAPGRMRPELVAIAFFNAGIRVFGISEPRDPREVAWFVPPHTGELDNYESWYRGIGETVFIEWDRKLIWLGSHNGTYCLSTPSLGEPVLEPRKIERWTIPHVNTRWDA